MNDYWKKEIVRLARYLQENFPDEVRVNVLGNIDQSSATDLAIILLERYKESRKNDKRQTHIMP